MKKTKKTFEYTRGEIESILANLIERVEEMRDSVGDTTSNDMIGELDALQDDLRDLKEQLISRY